MIYTFKPCSEQFHPKLVFVNGTSRAGKTLISKALATTKEIEWIEEPYFLEYLLTYCGLKMMSADACEELFLYCIKEIINEVILLRGGISFRYRDINSIWNVKEPAEIFDRLANLSTRNEVIDYIEKNNKIFLINMVDVAKYSAVIKQWIPDAVLIHVVRDGFDLATDVAKKPWYTNEYLIKPMGMGPYYPQTVKTHLGDIHIPFWVEDTQLFVESSLYERCLLYWNYSEDYDNSFEDILIKYEDFVQNADSCIFGICEQLSLTPTDRTGYLVDAINQDFVYNICKKGDLSSINKLILAETQRIRFARGYN